MVPVPAKTKPGDFFTAALPSSEKIVSRCPENCYSGDVLEVTFPSAPQKHTVIVPPNIQPGQKFEVFLPSGQKRIVTSPPNSRPGQKIGFSAIEGKATPVPKKSRVRIKEFNFTCFPMFPSFPFVKLFSLIDRL